MRKKINPETSRILGEAHDWIVQLEDAHVSDHMRAQFEAWLNRDPKHKQLYEHAKMSRTLFESVQISDVPEHLRYTPLRAFKSRVMDVVDFFLERRRLTFGVSGAVAVAAVFVLFLFPTTAVHKQVSAPIIAAYESPLGERQSIMLSDGTAVTLGARSAIKTRFSDDKRLIELIDGVAYFDVAPDPFRPLTVEAGDLTVTAVGTEFDVRHVGKTYRVGVAEGQVRVGFPVVVNGEKIDMRTKRDLGAGQEVSATLADGLSDISSTSDGYIAAWRTDTLIYRGVSIEDLVADLNRYSQIPIVIDDPQEAFADLRFRGVFREINVEEVLQTLSDVHPVSVERSDADQWTLRFADDL